MTWYQHAGTDVHYCDGAGRVHHAIVTAVVPDVEGVSVDILDLRLGGVESGSAIDAVPRIDPHSGDEGWYR